MVRREDDGQKWEDARACLPTQDSFALLRIVDGLWKAMQTGMGRHYNGCRFKQVAVTFLDLEPVAASQYSLLSLVEEKKSHQPALNHAIDALNEKYRRPMVSLASNMAPAIKDMGTKIAFTRVPELAEFHE